MCKPVRKREWIDKSGLTMVMDEGIDEFDAEVRGEDMTDHEAIREHLRLAP